MDTPEDNEDFEYTVPEGMTEVFGYGLEDGKGGIENTVPEDFRESPETVAEDEKSGREYPVPDATVPVLNLL